jgi:D-alanine--poly(phosphoribitol) ligase subunit 2
MNTPCSVNMFSKDDFSLAQEAIRNQVIQIARQLGKDARNLRADQEIPATGLLDSAGLMELMMWYETTYNLAINQDEFTVENFGTVDAMVRYLERSRA